MDDLTRSIDKYMQEPEFKQEWENSELEYQIQDMLIKARTGMNLTQSELAQISGIRQSNISRIENGSVVPSINTLKLLAKAMGKHLIIALE